MQRKTPVLKFLFNKVTVQQLSCEYCRVFMKSFFHKTPVAASEKFIKFLEKKKKLMALPLSQFYVLNL